MPVAADLESHTSLPDSREYTNDVFAHNPHLVSQVPEGRPRGEFMIPLPLDRDHVRRVPRTAGCYIIYIGESAYYAGMSRTDLRTRLWAHATGRGSKMIRQKLAEALPMYFEYCNVDAESHSSRYDISRAEFCFMLLHTGVPLPGNLKLDGISLFSNRASPQSTSLGTPENLSAASPDPATG